eukprot:1627979-Rhodomonas_salina.1
MRMLLPQPVLTSLGVRLLRQHARAERGGWGGQELKTSIAMAPQQIAVADKNLALARQVRPLSRSPSSLLPPSLPPSLSPSLTHSLIHSLTPSLTPSLPPSLSLLSICRLVCA